jgi:hypothetical protein
VRHHLTSPGRGVRIDLTAGGSPAWSRIHGRRCCCCWCCCCWGGRGLELGRQSSRNREAQRARGLRHLRGHPKGLLWDQLVNVHCVQRIRNVCHCGSCWGVQGVAWARGGLLGWFRGGAGVVILCCVCPGHFVWSPSGRNWLGVSVVLYLSAMNLTFISFKKEKEKKKRVSLYERLKLQDGHVQYSVLSTAS